MSIILLLLLFSLHAAQSSVIMGINKLAELGISAARPGDYFAEMLKTDTHMRRVSN